MKVTLIAHLNGSMLNYIRPEDLASIDRLVPNLSFFTSDMSKYGHVPVGSVEVEVDLLPPDQIVGNIVLSLRAQAQEIRDKATLKVTELESKAQHLLALENKGN